MQFSRKTKLHIWAVIIVALLFCPSFSFAAETVISSGDAKLIMEFKDGLNIPDGDSLKLVYTGSAADPSALLRDTSGNPSYWGGSFWSNYSVIFTNTNGITIGANANIQAASFIASTLDISNDNFLHPEKYNNSYIFSKWIDKAGKSVINNGYIKVREAGQVVLLGSAAANSGTIEATLGSVALASGEKITLGLDSANMISVVINDAVKEEIFTADGKKLANAVENSGTIIANGGKVVLAAKVLGKVFDYAVNNSGIIQAKSVVNRDGVIELTASGAPIVNSGTLDAAQIRIDAQGTDFINTLSINATSLSSNSGPVISIQADNLQQEGSIDTTGVVIIEANNVLSSLPVDGKVNPAVIIRANEVRIAAKQFGSMEAPLNIDASLTYINRTQGNIDILESLGIGTSILLRGPPDGFGAILYNRNTSLTLDANQVIISGTDSIRLYGNITFSNLTCTVPGKEIYFEAGKTYTILGDLVLTGGYGKLLKLRSSVVGEQWFIDPRGSRSLEFISVKDSDNINSEEIVAIRSNKEENCTNWDPTTTWIGNGADNNWSNGDNWDTGVAPPAGNDVLFDGISDNGSKDATIDIFGTNTITSLTITSGYGGIITQTADLTITGGYIQEGGTFNAANTLYIGGDWSVTGGTFNAGSGTVNFNGVTTQNIKTGDNAFNNVNLGNFIVLVTATGNLTINVNLNISQGKTPTITTNNQDFYVGGNTDGVDGASTETLTIDAGTGAVTFNGYIHGQGGGLNSSGLTHITITNAGTTNFNSDISISGVLSQTNAATGTTTFGAVVSTGGAVLRGTSYNFNSAFDTSSYTAYYLDADGSFSITNSETATFNNTVNLAGTFTKDGSGTVVFGDAMTCSVVNINAGTIDLNGVDASGIGEINVASGATLRWQGTENPSTPTLSSGSTVEYYGAGGTVYTVDWIYDVLNIAGSGIFTVDGELSASTVNVNSGTLDMAGYNMGGITNAMNVASGATLRMQGTEVPLLSPPPSLASDSTVEYYDVGGTIYTAWTYDIVTISGPGIFALDGELNAKDINLNSGTLDVNNFDIYLSGSWNNGGGTRVNISALNATTVHFTGSGYINSNGNAFDSVSIEASGTYMLYSDLTCSDETSLGLGGNFDISSGTLDSDGYDIYVEGNWTNDGGSFIAREGTVTFCDSLSPKTITSGSSPFNNIFFDNGFKWVLQDALDVDGNLIIDTCELDANDQDITVAGNWDTTYGTFNYGINGNTVTFDDANTKSYIYGDTTFWNFACTTPGKTIYFEDGSEQYIDNDLTIVGGYNDPIYLASFNPDNSWYIALYGSSQNITHVTVSDSNALDDFPLLAKGNSDITNVNNYNWEDGNTYWTGLAFDNDWENLVNWSTGVVPGASDYVVFDDNVGRNYDCIIAVDYGPVTIYGLEIENSYTSVIDTQGNVLDIELDMVNNSTNALITSSIGDLDITAATITSYGPISNTSDSGRILLTADGGPDGATIWIYAPITSINGDILLTATNDVTIEPTGSSYSDSSTRSALIYIDSADITSDTGDITLSANNTVTLTIEMDGTLSSYDDSSENYAKVHVPNFCTFSTGGTIRLEAINTVTRGIEAGYIGDDNFEDNSSNYSEVIVYADFDATTGAGAIELDATNSVTNTVDGGSYIYDYEDNSDNYSQVYAGSNNQFSTYTGATTIASTNSFIRTVIADSLRYLDDYSHSYAETIVTNTPLESTSGAITVSATNTADFTTTISGEIDSSGYIYSDYYVYAKVDIVNNSSSETLSTAGSIDIDADNNFTEDIDVGTLSGYYGNEAYSDYSNYAYVHIYDTLDTRSDGTGTGTIDITADNYLYRTIDSAYIDEYYDYSYNHSYVWLENAPLYADKGNITILSKNIVTNILTVTPKSDDGQLHYYDYEPYNYAELYFNAGSVYTTGSIDIDCTNTVTNTITSDYIGDDYSYDWSYNYATIVINVDLNTASVAGTGTVDLTAINIVNNTVDGGAYIYYYDDESSNYAYIDLNNSLYTDLGTAALTADNRFTRTVTADTIDGFYDYTTTYGQLYIGGSSGTIYTATNFTLDAINTVTKNNYDESTDNDATIDFNNVIMDVMGTGTVTAEYINFNSGAVWTLNNTLTVNGNLTVASDATLAIESETLELSGNLANNGGLNTGTGTVTFNGSTTISGSSETLLNNVDISGTLTAPAGNMNVAGSWTNNGTFNANGGTVTFNGLVMQFIGGSVASTFNNLTINNPGGVTLDISPTISGTLTFSEGSGKFNITVTAVVGDTKDYDGDTSSESVPTITSGGLVSGDTATWTQTFNDKNAGEGKTLTPDGTVDDGNDGGNYDVTFVEDTTGVITPIAITVTGISASDKVYDGTTDALLYGTGALDGFIAGDTVDLDTADATGAFEDSNVGVDKIVTIAGLTIGGLDAANYSLIQPTALADITASNSNFINTLLSNGGSVYFIPPDSGSFGQFQFNTFNPIGGPVYFYHPLTPMDMSAFDALMLGDDAYQFIGGTINIIGHDGLLPFMKK